MNTLLLARRLAPPLFIFLAAGCSSAPTIPPPSADLAVRPGDLLVPPGSDLSLPPGSDLAVPPGSDLTMGNNPDLAMGQGCGAPCMAPNPVCDPDSKKCVACLPGNDVCADGSYCLKGMNGYSCEKGCKADKDCKGGRPACCSHVCADLTSDGMNCGACAMGCGMGKACCDAACTDTSSDIKHCGGCGMACAQPPKSTVACQQSMCKVTGCAAPFADCNMNGGDGCETNLDTDLGNCTACGKPCDLANAMSECNKACLLKGCFAGFGDCDKDPKNGCETETTKDVNHCGGCGMACPVPANGIAACTAGKCGSGGCKPGFADCDMNAMNGCETATDADPKNCGACAKVCPSLICKGGTCQAVMCNAPLADCDMNAMNGCEVDTSSDVKNCGACAKACTVANGTPGCKNGQCTVAACAMGFADCDGNPANGCEVDTTKDAKNCGKCAVACAQGQTCVAGACKGGGVVGTFGPQHTFAGLTTDHFITQGCCGVNCAQVDATNADYFCKHFYGDNCNVQPGYTKHTTPNGTYPKMHKNGGCTNQGSDIPNTTCDAGPCKIGNWNEITSGLNNLVCVCGNVYGPQHTFAGLTTDHYITQGCCGVNCAQVDATNADYFCKHFYNAQCTVRPGYMKHTTPNGTYPKMHKNGGCTNQGSDIPNTTCDAGPCKIGNWNEVTSGLNNLICDCPLPCGNPNGGNLSKDNGTGKKVNYCYNQGDSGQVRAQKSCESHFGVGKCCVIMGGYQSQQYGECGKSGEQGTFHFHYDNWPQGHCAPNYVIGDVVSPGWCGVVLGNFIK